MAEGSKLHFEPAKAVHCPKRVATQCSMTADTRKKAKHLRVCRKQSVFQIETQVFGTNDTTERKSPQLKMDPMTDALLKSDKA